MTELTRLYQSFTPWRNEETDLIGLCSSYHQRFMLLNKHFAEMLNRLREGNHSTEDILKFKERIIEPNHFLYPKDIPHLFIQNAKVNDFNDRAHQAISVIHSLEK